MTTFQYHDKQFEVRDDTYDTYVVKEVSQYLKRIKLEKDDIWLDAGANIGSFSVSIGDKVAKVFAYEPERENFELLQKNVISNSCGDVFFFQAALVPDNKKEIDFYVNLKRNKGSHTIFCKKGRDKVTVQAININKAIKDCRINKIKMDVEGAEYELLKAINHWELIREIIFEFHFLVLKDTDHKKYFEIVKLLKKHFRVVNYNKEPKKNWTVLVHATK